MAISDYMVRAVSSKGLRGIKCVLWFLYCSNIMHCYMLCYSHSLTLTSKHSHYKILSLQNSKIKIIVNAKLKRQSSYLLSYCLSLSAVYELFIIVLFISISRLCKLFIIALFITKNRVCKLFIMVLFIITNKAM